MPSEINIRTAVPSDHPTLARVMFDSVRNTEGLYSDFQRAAWAPVVRQGKEWQERLSGLTLIMAEDDSHVMGFIGFTQAGYIDFAYVSPSFQRRGVFRRLYQEVEQHALQVGHSRLWSHVSLDARLAFKAVGFKVVHRETVYMRGEPLDRFEVEKHLPQ